MGQSGWSGCKLQCQSSCGRDDDESLQRSAHGAASKAEAYSGSAVPTLAPVLESTGSSAAPTLPSMKSFQDKDRAPLDAPWTRSASEDKAGDAAGKPTSDTDKASSSPAVCKDATNHGSLVTGSSSGSHEAGRRPESQDNVSSDQDNVSSEHPSRQGSASLTPRRAGSKDSASSDRTDRQATHPHGAYRPGQPVEGATSTEPQPSERRRNSASMSADTLVGMPLHLLERRQSTGNDDEWRMHHEEQEDRRWNERLSGDNHSDDPASSVLTHAGAAARNKTSLASKVLRTIKRTSP